MKKIITTVVLVSLVCISTNEAFAQYWKKPSGVETNDPAPKVFQNDLT